MGTLLLWEGNKENYEKLACAPLYAFDRSLDPEYIVLDGQQRLSDFNVQADHSALDENL